MHERYLAGDRARVWHELRQFGDRIREPGLWADAQAVCDEMARRAQRNIETLIDRLDGQGYVFHSNDGRRNPVRPYYPATERGGLALAWLGEHVGTVPWRCRRGFGWWATFGSLGPIHIGLTRPRLILS